MNNKPLARNKDLLIQESGDELLIYDLKTNKAYCLNETSAVVWHLCNGKSLISEITENMSKQLKTPINDDFVWVALDQLNKDGLFEDKGDLDEQFAGSSRREMIRKVGFASVIALPIISSLVAPRAMMAASGGGALLAPCTPGPGACISGNCNTTVQRTAGSGSPVPTGIRCCASNNGNSFPNSTFCSNSACSVAGLTECCSGNASDAPTPSLACQLTCICN